MPQKSQLVYVAEFLTLPDETTPNKLGTELFQLACQIYSEMHWQQTSHEKNIREVEFERLCNILERNFPRKTSGRSRYENWHTFIKNICLEDRQAWTQIHSSLLPLHERLCQLFTEELAKTS